MNLKPHRSYLGYVLRHKWYVFKACLVLKVPIRLAIFHDLSKFSKAEWSPYVHHFYRMDGSRREKLARDNPYFLSAWHHHERNNKHHWSYWITFNGYKPAPVNIPDVFIREMVADWIGAAQANGQFPAPETWFAKNGAGMSMTDQTSKRVWELINTWTEKSQAAITKERLHIIRTTYK